MLTVKESKNGIIFNIHVIPRSAKCGIAGIQADALKIKITAPPIEGRANAECIRLLSDTLGIKKNQITIVSGHKSKKKTVAIGGLNSEDIMTMLSGILPSQNVTFEFSEK
jgi:uncharacterized protein (TIGR00251 family)